ncbi:MAG: hypothetical protein J07HQX50_00939 [Haloquadratum sp. J07HQX50]|nr:MAG: hypothetical protein J07HQX50_00939 [Haloquadratum sp. J07HQX50]
MFSHERFLHPHEILEKVNRPSASSQALRLRIVPVLASRNHETEYSTPHLHLYPSPSLQAGQECFFDH